MMADPLPAEQGDVRPFAAIVGRPLSEHLLELPIVTASLISIYRPEQLRRHLARALDNGVTQNEIAKVISHLAFYSGWPASVTAARLAEEAFEERGPGRD